MAEAGIDVLMRVVNKGRALQAESRTVFAVNRIIDGLRADFDEGQFCELREFNFSAGAISATVPPAKKDESAFQAQIRQRAFEMRKKRAVREGNRANLETVDIQPVEYTRILDTASTLLFKALVGCEDAGFHLDREAEGCRHDQLRPRLPSARLQQGADDGPRVEGCRAHHRGNGHIHLPRGRRALPLAEG